MIASRSETFDVDDCPADKIVDDSNVIILITVYRSPSLNHDQSLQLMQSFYSFLESLLNDHIVILTDHFNLPDINRSDGTVRSPSTTNNALFCMQAQFLDTLRLNHLQWCIDNSTSTRVNLLDLSAKEKNKWWRDRSVSGGKVNQDQYPLTGSR